MSKFAHQAAYTVITLRNEGKFISLYTEDKYVNVSGEFMLNTASLQLFLDADDPSFFDFDARLSLTMHRLSDATVTMHLIWVDSADDPAYAYRQSFLLPVALLRRVLAGKTVNAVVDNTICNYDLGVAREFLASPVVKAYCGEFNAAM